MSTSATKSARNSNTIIFVSWNRCPLLLNMSQVIHLLQNNQIERFDPIGHHFDTFQHEFRELLHAIRGNESVVDFMFDPWARYYGQDDFTLPRGYLDLCYILLDACTHLRGLRRAHVNTSHIPLSLIVLCEFLEQAQQLEHFSFGPMLTTSKRPLDSTCWLDGPIAVILHVIREHSSLISFHLHLPNQTSEVNRVILSELPSLSNLHELRISVHGARADDADETHCWMSPLLQMPHLNRLTLPNVCQREIAELTTALQDNTTLQELSLNDCQFDELGWEALARVLQTNSNLQVFSIHHRDRFPDRFVMHLTESLILNDSTSLRVIHLSGASSEGCTSTKMNAALLDLLQTNNTLQSIKVEGCEQNARIDMYLKLNQAGRSRLDCIYTMLRDNPNLCNRCTYV